MFFFLFSCYYSPGDSILARPTGTNQAFKGYAHFVNLEDIRVSFHAFLPITNTFCIQVTCSSPSILTSRHMLATLVFVHSYSSQTDE